MLTLTNLKICILYCNNNDRTLTHKASRVSNISPDFSINFNQSLFENLFHLVIRQSIFEAVPEEYNEGQTLAQLVRTSGRTWCLQQRLQFFSHTDSPSDDST